jgi:hypothetical protein
MPCYIQLVKLSDSFTRRNIAIASSVFAVGIVVAGFFVMRRPPRVAMERYAPARALAFVEVDSVGDLVDGLTHTQAWRELAPVLGLSSQLGQIGMVTDFIGRTGLGPDEAVVAGRAQYAIAITGVDSNAGETSDGAYIHLKPLFSLIIETQSKPDVAARLVRERAPAIAERIYGESVSENTEEYHGSPVMIFRGSGSRLPLYASALGSVVLLANDSESMTACLDSIAGRATSLAEDSTLKQRRSEVGDGASVFGYVTASGIQKLVELWPLLALSRAADPDTASLVADLIEHVSKESVSGLLYSLAFESDGVTEKYLTILHPEMADALMEPLKPAPAASFVSPRLIPRSIESLTLLSAEQAGDLPERVLKRISPNVDIVAGVALREFVINFRKQYGLQSSDSIGAATGPEIAIVNFGDDQPRAMLIKVSDKSKLETAVARYLARKGGSVGREQSAGVEIMISSSDDRRAAAFVGEFLVLATRDQILKIIETLGNRDGLDSDVRFKQILASRPADASIASYRSGVDDAGNLLLAISKLTRVTDGSPELLDRDAARQALNHLPRSNSVTEFRGSGIYIETHSAVGNFSALGSLVGNEADSR